jgi:hypothetical protein
LLFQREIILFKNAPQRVVLTDFKASAGLPIGKKSKLRHRLKLGGLLLILVFFRQQLIRGDLRARFISFHALN